MQPGIFIRDDGTLVTARYDPSPTYRILPDGSGIISGPGGYSNHQWTCERCRRMLPDSVSRYFRVARTGEPAICPHCAEMPQ